MATETLPSSASLNAEKPATAMAVEASKTEVSTPHTRNSLPPEVAHKPAQTMAMAAAEPCPICLNPIKDNSFLDPCFHNFCFLCILHWAEVTFTHPSMEDKTQLGCPLCRRPSSCIIHSFVLDTFQRHYLFGVSPSKYGFFPSVGHYQRLYVYRNRLHTYVAQSFEQRLKCRRRFLFISGNTNLRQWVRRELQALMQVRDVDLVTQLVLGLLKNHEDKQKVDSCASATWMEAMLDAMKPFLFENVENFCVELQTFLYCGLNVKAYDLLVEDTVRENTLKLLPLRVKRSKVNVSEFSSEEALKG